MVTAGVAFFVATGALQFLAPLVFGLAVAIFAGSTGPIARALSTKMPSLLGAWSYSIYMVHTVFVALIWAIAPRLGLGRAGVHLTADPVVEVAIFAAYVVAVIGAAYVSYTFFERPIYDYFRRKAAGERRASA